MATPGASPPLARTSIDGGAYAVIAADGSLWVESEPLTSEGLLAFARRLCGNAGVAETIAAANRGISHLEAGARYRVPFELVTPELQRAALRALFPDDRPSEAGWRHTVRGVGPLAREGVWHLAQWFTGDGTNFARLRDHNELSEEELPAGRTVEIPAELLRPALRAALPRVAAAVPAVAGEEVAAEPAVLRRPSTTAADYGLEYGRDADGEYAVYRLRPGEALYSSVIVRFTGRLLAVDVNALAAEVARRSGIDDVTDIPVGYRVQVPFELLLPEYLPADHPRRREYERGLLASRRYSNRLQARDLAGITIILDPGHGGRDPGASTGGVWESVHVYDIALRVKRVLEERTAARVLVTTRDGGSWSIAERDALPISKSHAVLTDPPYRIEDSRVSAHLRWYLANSHYRAALAKSGDPAKTLFLSIHADSLHSSVRGATVYIPGASMIGGEFGKSGTVYASRREVRERPRVRYSAEERLRSEGLSRQLAERLLDEFRLRDLAIHPSKPVREKIIRKRRSYVPAVLRYNAVPAKALLEVCNLANREDRGLLQTRAFRQQVAEAVVDGILAYYGSNGAAGTHLATAAR